MKSRISGNVDEFKDGIRLGRGAVAHFEQLNSIQQFTIQEHDFLFDLSSANPAVAAMAILCRACPNPQAN